MLYGRGKKDNGNFMQQWKLNNILLLLLWENEYPFWIMCVCWGVWVGLFVCLCGSSYCVCCSNHSNMRSIWAIAVKNTVVHRLYTYYDRKNLTASNEIESTYLQNVIMKYTNHNLQQNYKWRLFNDRMRHVN